MASSSINIKLTGSQVDSTSISQSKSNTDGISTSLVIQSKTKKIKVMSESNKDSNTQSSNDDNEPIKINVNKPNIAKLTAEALKTTASLVDQIGTDGAKDTADIMRKSAKVAETIPVAVAGIKKEAKPAVTAIGNLWDALEEQGIVGVRERVNIADMRKKNNK